MNLLKSVLLLGSNLSFVADSRLHAGSLRQGRVGFGRGAAKKSLHYAN